jgi:hypothetical protein
VYRGEGLAFVHSPDASAVSAAEPSRPDVAIDRQLPPIRPRPQRTTLRTGTFRWFDASTPIHESKRSGGRKARGSRCRPWTSWCRWAVNLWRTIIIDRTTFVRREAFDGRSASRTWASHLAGQGRVSWRLSLRQPPPFGPWLSLRQRPPLSILVEDTATGPTRRATDGFRQRTPTTPHRQHRRRTTRSARSETGAAQAAEPAHLRRLVTSTECSPTNASSRRRRRTTGPVRVRATEPGPARVEGEVVGQRGSPRRPEHRPAGRHRQRRPSGPHRRGHPTRPPGRRATAIVPAPPGSLDRLDQGRRRAQRVGRLGLPARPTEPLCRRRPHLGTLYDLGP